MTKRIAGTFAAALAACLSGPGAAWGDCICRYDGGTVEVGLTACIRTPNGERLARCDMVINNPSWTFLEAPCPMAGMTPAPAKRDGAKHLHERRPAVAEKPRE